MTINQTEPGKDQKFFKSPPPSSPELTDNDLKLDLLTKLKNYFQPMNSHAFHRAIGMINTKVIKVDTENKAGVLMSDGQLYPCVFLNKYMMRKLNEMEGKEVMISFWPTMYKKIPLPNGEKKKILILQIKGFRPDIPENGYIEVRGIVSDIEPKENKFKVAIKEQRSNKVHKIRIWGKYTGRIGDFIIAECLLNKGDIQLKNWIVLADNQRVPFSPKPTFNKNRNYSNNNRNNKN